jgi:formate dehydrogenase subunit gamma
MSRKAARRAHPWFGRIGVTVAALIFALSGLTTFLAHEADAQSVRPPANAVTNAAPAPGDAPAPAELTGEPADALNTRGAASDSDLWRAIRVGESFETQKRGAVSGMLVQSEGSVWAEMREGPISLVGLVALGGMILMLAAFYLVRGRIRIDQGPSGETIERFDGFERFGHWLIASSFVILGISGLCMMYGRELLIPIVGKEAFASFMDVAKFLHHHVAFAFMAGLVIIFVMWVIPNIPNKTDLIWISKAGGLFSKNVHPPAKKFNAGQKSMFWLTILLGTSLSMSGWALLFPFEYAFFAPTFETLNRLGLNLPTELTMMQEMQLAQLWHGLVGAVMVALILAHIYIGSLGMEGAFDAMGSGQVDVNWAREHHGLWVEEVEEKRASAPRDAAATPAE